MTANPGSDRLDALLAQVLASVGGEDARVRELVGGLVAHLHAFVRESRPTEAEWLRAVDFLVRVGQTCTETRNEFILLSDMLGVTSAVDEVNHTGPPTMTPPARSRAPSTRPRRPAPWAPGSPRAPSGTAASPPSCTAASPTATATPSLGAVLDVWQSNDTGLYDSQDAEQPDGNLRALLTTGDDGAYWFRTVKPSSYPVPTDGPVGELLRAIGRHPMRPAHVHIKVQAAGHRPLTTHIFVAGDPYLGSDAAFAVKDALVTDFLPSAGARFGMDGPFLAAEFDIRLVEEGDPR
ncbi:dioxygenase [Nonomuraea ferruginea]